MFRIEIRNRTDDKIMHNVTFDKEADAVSELDLLKNIYKAMAEEFKNNIIINIYLFDNLRKCYEYNYEV